MTGVTENSGDPVGPTLSRLVARRRDLDEAQRALTGTRLLTLTGPGGVGKTRLAVELAHRIRSGFSDGVWLAQLADLGTAAGTPDVESALISALGISDQSAADRRETLASFLSARKLLLVVDNCEHVLPAAREVLTALVRAAPHLRIVATSREPLGIDGEVVRPVHPLSVPAADATAADLATDASAVLLVDRARAVDPEFGISEENAPSVVELCRLLDGMPLAIELAAVKLRALTVDQVVQRFRRRLVELSGPPGGRLPRHRSLRAIVEWSYDLSSTSARILWRRLSVFPAGFDLELAEEVCAFGEIDRDDVLGLVEALVGQSILLTDRPSARTMRYRLLAPLRDFAAELADHAGETAELHERHRDAVLRRAERVLELWCGPRQGELLEDMRLDHPNYVAALQWSSTTPGESRTGLRLMAAVRYYWLSGGQLAEGRMRTELLLDSSTGPSRERADCLWVLVWHALLQADHDTARRRLQELAALGDALGDATLDAHVDHWSALLALFTGDAASAVPGFRRAVAGHRQNGDLWLELMAQSMLANALAVSGRAAEALELCETALAACEQCGERVARSYTLWTRGVAQWSLGHLDAAELSARTLLELQRTVGDPICIALTLELLASVAHRRGDVQRAAGLAEAGNRAWRELGLSLRAFGPQDWQLAARDRPLPRPTPAGGPDRFSELDDLMDLALGTTAPPSARRATSDMPLTARELEVAALVERGLSNREIAQRLVIAKRTADGHVERILAKLEFNSRAQIAAWMARHAPPAAAGSSSPGQRPSARRGV